MAAPAVSVDELMKVVLKRSDSSAVSRDIKVQVHLLTSLILVLEK